MQGKNGTFQKDHGQQMGNPALLIIDMCADFFNEGRLLESRDRLVSATNELADHFRSKGLPVIWIRQEFSPDLSDAFLDMRQKNIRITIRGTPGAMLLSNLKVAHGDVEIIKKRYSAFYKTDLDDILSKLNCSTLVLAGVNTHACIRTAAVDAFQRDFEIIFADDAIDSYDEQFHEESKRYLDGRLGNFMSNRGIKEFLGKF
jgi:nicotinamidase-related amidase